MQKLMQAIYDVVERHGSAAVCEGASFSSRTLLLQKANPDYDSHKMNVQELDRIMSFTQDLGPLHAWADKYGHDLVPRERPAPVALLAGLAQLAREFAELTVEVHTAADDGHVCRLDRKRIELEIEHVRDALNVLKQSVRSA
ncbi:hypothetical protein NRB16_07970 [Pseudomonas sp. LJDD11]|uniref:phage regulatory CII family protein n=1 Tax=Pseudomonas sp. LJDD11 TaxID=2931984 RepID=UPI00211D120B|nr:phage regulatory CII family protein [Pseudomonas sp. LJDD11]MCQ9423456.1 hypothetical protein [Pseudomonas sp. LJDD11]